MNHFALYCLFFICSLNGWSQSEFVSRTIQILANSELSIQGDTNISEFGCVFNTAYLEDNIEIIYKKNGNKIKFKNAVLSLKNKGFDCGNRAINKDFHSLLKTKEYPIITLKLTEITLYSKTSGKACVKILIAGKEHEYIFGVNIISTPINRFVGKLKLDIRDFNLEPPTKMFGLIVIENEIEIEFDLVAKL